MKPPMQSSACAELETAVIAHKRIRKVLPPLSASPTRDHARRQSHSSSVEDEQQPEDLDRVSPRESKEESERLLQQHVLFAHAFKLNDPAQLLPYFARDVVLTKPDGSTLTGASQVLGYFVGSKLAKLTTLLHIKGRPTSRGPWQTMFLYEHGLLIKTPLYAEMIQWRPHSSVIEMISHTSVTKSTECRSKVLVDATCGYAVAPGSSSGYRRHSSSSSSGRSSEDRASFDRSKLTLATQPTQFSSNDSARNPPAEPGVIAISHLAVLSHLTPIRRRKSVNPFVMLETKTGEGIWKSKVAHKVAQPTWTLGLPLRDDESVFVSLWDKGTFQAICTARAELVLGDALRNADALGEVTIHLDPLVLGYSEPIAVSLVLERTVEPSWQTRQSSMRQSEETSELQHESEDETQDKQDESMEENALQLPGGAAFLNETWFARAVFNLIGLVLVLLHFGDAGRQPRRL